MGGGGLKIRGIGRIGRTEERRGEGGGGYLFVYVAHLIRSYMNLHTQTDRWIYHNSERRRRRRPSRPAAMKDCGWMDGWKKGPRNQMMGTDVTRTRGYFANVRVRICVWVCVAVCRCMCMCVWMQDVKEWKDRRRRYCPPS